MHGQQRYIVAISVSFNRNLLKVVLQINPFFQRKTNQHLIVLCCRLQLVVEVHFIIFYIIMVFHYMAVRY